MGMACIATLYNHLRPTDAGARRFTMNASPLSHVHVFLAVARLRSFSGAARELGVSRSAASQAVRQLEERLRVVLLSRTTRSVLPTDAGKRLLEAAGPAFGQVLAALANASAQPG